MKKKKESLYTIRSPLYTPGAELLIIGGGLKESAKNGDKSCFFRLCALSDLSLQSVTLGVRLFDQDDRQLGEDLLCTIPVNQLTRDEVFGEKNLFQLSDSKAVSLLPWLSAVLYADGLVEEFDPSSSLELHERQLLEDALGSEDLADQYRVRYGTDCRYLRAEEADLWYCACGGINRQDEQKCHVCRRAKKALTGLNLESLKAETDKRLKREQESGISDKKRKEKREKDRADNAPAVAKNQKKTDITDNPRKQKADRKSESSEKKRRSWIIAIPLVLLIVLLLATVPGAVLRDRNYNQAKAALTAGNLEEAEELFLKISSFRDSQEILDQEIPYLRAEALANQTSSDDEKQISLYLDAASAFEALGDYRDADTRKADLETRAKELEDKLNYEARLSEYRAAAELLERGAYSEAKEAFLALGDFNDSADMVIRCSYEKAEALYDFLQHYHVSRIYADLTANVDETSVFSLPASEEVRISCVEALKAACGEDKVEIRLEDAPSSDSLQPFGEALASFYKSLGNFENSRQRVKEVREETDYTSDFFRLCEEGSLADAWEWLSSYEGDFPDKDHWLSLLETYIPYSHGWYLYSGDPMLLAFTIGQTFPSTTIYTNLLLTDKTATLQLWFGEDFNESYQLTAEPGETLFTNRDNPLIISAAAISNIGHLSFIRYDSDWVYLNAAEYEPA